jgi:hypothetical protein
VILKPTVLIIGAGASKPYGYPLGAGLVDHILALIKPKEGDLWSVLTGGYQTSHLRDFHKSLWDSKPASIDDFLEANTAFRELGKVCITAALTVFGPRTDEPENQEFDWLRFLWWRLHDDAPTAAQFAGNQLKVVTYNYDMTFERYFANVLSAFYPDLKNDPARAAAFRDEVLPVVHIHGSLGASSDEVRRLDDPRERNLITWYKHAAGGIRILSEGEHAVPYGRAHEWFRDADVIYLLGFGYHRTNTDRLDLKGQLLATESEHPSRIVKGTALGLGEAERLDAQRRLGLEHALLQQRGGLFESDARSFLEKHGLA